MSTSISPNGDIALLHPLVRKKVKAIQTALKKERIPFEVFEASRTPQRQAHLYAQGRTRPGNKVTWVRPWGSIHQYGLAVDFVLKIDGRWSWDDTGPEARYWTRMHELAKANGMTPLFKNGRLIEKPHIQLIGTSAAELRKGHYPEDGDADWADHLANMIDGWPGPEAPPPKPDIAPILPRIAPDIMAQLESDEPAPPVVTDFSVATASVSLTSAEAEAKFRKMHGFIKLAEGGFVSHPEDNDGGATNFGITRKTLSAWRGRETSVEDVANMTQEEADAILRTNYYARCRCGELPDRIAMVMYNTAVMSGPKRAVEMLQKAFNGLGLTVAGRQLVVDGKLGAKSMAAATKTDPSILSDAYIDHYSDYLRGLSNFGTFGNGWMNRMAKLREFLATMPAGSGERPLDTLQITDTETEAMTVESEVEKMLEHADLRAPDRRDRLRGLVAAAIAKRAGGGERGDVLDTLVDLLQDRDGLKDRIIDGARDRARDVVTARIVTPDGKPLLTPVNAALGEGIGRLLNGKKSVIGVVGLIATVILPQLGVLDPAAAQALQQGDLQTTLITLLSIFTGWGFLGKIDKAIRAVRTL